MGNKSTLTFGVGCYHFGINRKLPFSISAEQYIKDVKSVLGSISNISEISITVDDFSKKRTLEAEDYYDEIGEGYSFLPNTSSRIQIKFEIYIPYRIQNDLNKLDRNRAGSERFEVITRYDSYFFPITYVCPINPDENKSPSDSVFIVREFLKQQFEAIKDSQIRFECLGPSPFHADFLLRSQSDSDSNVLSHGLSYNITKRLGYNKFEFFYDASVFPSIYSAKQDLFEELKFEFAVFYATVHSNVMRMRKWEELQKLMTQLIEVQKKKGLLSTLEKYLASFKDLNDIFFALAEFESQEVMINYEFHNNFNSISETRVPVLQEYIQNLKDVEYFVYPTSQVRELIMIFESQRNKKLEGLMLLISSILGGAVGAIITLLSTNR